MSFVASCGCGGDGFCWLWLWWVFWPVVGVVVMSFVVFFFYWWWWLAVSCRLWVLVYSCAQQRWWKWLLLLWQLFINTTIFKGLLLFKILNFDAQNTLKFTSLQSLYNKVIYLYYYLRSFPYLGSSFFQLKNALTPLSLSRDKTKGQSDKNTTLTLTKTLSKKQGYSHIDFQIVLSIYKLKFQNKNYIYNKNTFSFFATKQDH